MTEQEIEKEQYVNSMRIKSIEASLERVNPFSDEFDNLISESLRLRDRQKELGQQLIITRTKAE